MRAIGEQPGGARQNFTSQFVVDAPGKLLYLSFNYDSLLPQPPA